MAHGFELEKEELREQLEKKEFTLQLLEQRLFDVELFLRKWGREDANVREQLTALKINPDLRKKKITNVVEENRLLKVQLKETMDEVEDLRQKLEDHSSTKAQSKEAEANYQDVPNKLQAQDLELSCFAGDPDQSLMNIEKMRSIKEVFPEDFNRKLEKGYEKLEEKI
jgi:chromosome segregation ATPase